MITREYAYPDGKFAKFASFVFVLVVSQESTGPSLPRLCGRRFSHHRQVDSLAREKTTFLASN